MEEEEDYETYRKGCYDLEGRIGHPVEDIHYVSNCCGAHIVDHDERGQGICDDCGEQCDGIEHEEVL
jgi:hypothetical protein